MTHNNGNVKTKEYLINNEIVDKIFIGVDPGKNGGVAVINEVKKYEGVISFRCPKNARDMAMALMATIPTDISYSDIIVAVEHVHSMPKQGVVSSFSFGQNLGQWEGIISSLELDIEYVSPRSWMGHYDLQWNLDRKDRKRFLRGVAENLFPNIKMTFNISDALLIANYKKEIYYSDLAKKGGR